MEVNIRRISSTVRVGDGAATAPAAADDAELDRLAEAVLQRQERLQSAAAARSLAPDDPAGELGRWC